jgi:hypothetical protein
VGWQLVDINFKGNLRHIKNLAKEIQELNLKRTKKHGLLARKQEIMSKDLVEP